MPTRIPASERTSQKLDDLLTQGIADGDARAELLKLAVRKIVEEALEAEVTDALGRGYYENGAPSGAGYRNGYRRGRLATAEGSIEYGVPQVTDRTEPFVSRVKASLAGRTAELERLAVEMFARGLSTRDIEAAFRDARGASVLSRTAVSQVTERLWQEYEAFAGRDLSEFAIAYLFVDGVAERLHAGLPREAVLCAWGITDDGQKVLLHLAPGTKEDTASCTAFFEDLKRRGLADPLLVVTDGAPGLIRAVETCFPRALRQRCLVHRLRNLRSKAPESRWPEIALRARGCYEAASPALATVLREDFVQTYERALPAVVQCFNDDFDAWLALGETPSRIRADCGALLPTLDAQIRRLDADLITRWGADARVRRLTTIPGIGPFIAIVLVLELGDIDRFASAKRVASYVGLTPRIRGSAGRVRAGHITKEGNRLLRWVLVLAATQAVRRPGPLRAWFHAVKKRRGKKVARVALARRLVEIVFHVWKQECDYFTVVRHGVVRG